MICELCGKDIAFLKPLLIEGSLLKVCPDCAKFGTEAPRETALEGGIAGETQSRIDSTASRSRADHSYPRQTQTNEEMIKQRLEFRARRMTSKNIFDQAGEKELVEDYHKRIQQARDGLGWNQEQLGQKINERKSIISKLENHSIKPDDKLVRKLEKALSIKLMEVLE